MNGGRIGTERRITMWEEAAMTFKSYFSRYYFYANRISVFLTIKSGLM